MPKSKIKRICIITKEFPPKKGGVSVHSYNLALGLAQMNFEVHVITDSGFTSTDFIVHNISKFNFPLLLLDQLYFAFMSARYLKKLMKTNNFDVIHIQSYAGIFLNNSLKTNLVLTIHDSVENEMSSITINSLFSFIEKYLILYPCILLEKIALKKIKRVITVSKSSADSISKLDYDNVINVVPNGISLVDSKPKKYPTKFRILSTGRLIKRKGFKYLLLAIKKVCLNNISIKLIIIGDGYERKSLLNLSKKLDIENHVSFLGAVSDKVLRECYRNSDLFVLPSLREGFCIVLLEAMSYGLPIIATDSGGVIDLVDRKSSYVVPIKDSFALSNAILDLIINKKKYETMSSAALKQASYFSYQSMAEKTLKVYKNL